MWGTRLRRLTAGRPRGRVHRSRPDAQRHRLRLAPLVRRAPGAAVSAQRGRRRHDPQGRGALIERVCERLPELAGPAEPPARLHGDLWNGNVLWGTDGHAWLIDPAAHGGHRETDLAMLHLFGCPHLDRILDGYQDTAPLTAGWTDRLALHQLFPLLVHAVLFGRGYAEQALAAAGSALKS
ncbi:fructosamine kinase family protein [Streptomyces sp. KS_5]|uniref:fructosamine kinase family protein n=1 Tax=Streptomyces sp. KS_5 TaxID=1881018 RepID=UPI0035245542